MVIEHLAFGLSSSAATTATIPRKNALHRFFWSDHQSIAEEQHEAYKSLYAFDPAKPCLILVSLEHYRLSMVSEHRMHAGAAPPGGPRIGSKIMAEVRKNAREWMNTVAPVAPRQNGGSSQASIDSSEKGKMSRDLMIPKLTRAAALSRTGSKMGQLLVPPVREKDREDRSKDSSPAPPTEEDLVWKSLLDFVIKQKKLNAKAAVKDGFCVLDFSLEIDESVSLSDLSRELRIRLEPFLSMFGEKQAIFMFANGIAGLVVKKLMEDTLPMPEKSPRLNSSSSTLGHEIEVEGISPWPEFYEKLQGISFFGTPHVGSVILASKALEKEAAQLLGFSAPLPQKLRNDLTKEAVSEIARWSTNRPNHLKYWYFHSHGFNTNAQASPDGNILAKNGQSAKVNQSASQIREGIHLLQHRPSWDTFNKSKALEIIESVGGIAEFPPIDKNVTPVFLNCRFAECARVTFETARQFLPLIMSMQRAAIRFAGTDQEMADSKGVRELYAHPFVAVTQLGKSADYENETAVGMGTGLDILLKAAMEGIPYISEHQTMGKFRISSHGLSGLISGWADPSARLVWVHSPIVDYEILEDCLNQTFRSPRKGYSRFHTLTADFMTRFEISPRPDVQPPCLTEGLRLRTDDKRPTPPSSPTSNAFNSPPRSPTSGSRPLSMDGEIAPPLSPVFGPSLMGLGETQDVVHEVVIPFLNFDSYFNLLKRRMVLKQRYRPATKFDSLINAVSGPASRERLAIRVQKNMFCRRTLHQYTNPTRVDSHIKDNEQVFYRATAMAFKEKEVEIGGVLPDVSGRMWEFPDMCAHFDLPKMAANGLVLMVDQLCVWANPHVVVTATTEGGSVVPGKYEQDELRHHIPGFETSFRESYEAKLSSDVTSVSRNGEGLELAAKLIHHALTLVFDHKEPALDILKAFNSAIGDCTLQGSHSLQDEKFETFKKQHTDYSRVMRNIQHLSSEVDSILKLLRLQLSILSELDTTFTATIVPGSPGYASTIGRQSPFSKTIKFVTTQEVKFAQVDRHMSKLKEEYSILSKLSRQDASLFEQQYKRQRDTTSSIQGKQLFILTIVTVIFTPLSFCASLFGMNVEEWGEGGQPQKKIGIILGAVAAGVMIGTIAVIRTIKAPPDIQLMLVPLKWTWEFLVACWQLCSPINWWVSTREYIRKRRYQESLGSYYYGGRYSADGSDSDHV